MKKRVLLTIIATAIASLTLTLLWVLGNQGPLLAAAETSPQLSGSSELALLQTDPCYVQVSSSPGITYTNIQAAVDGAQGGDLVKVAGHCAGVSFREGTSQTVYISKSITLQGGYTTTNWTTPDPVANPTTLDAESQGGVIKIMGDIGPTVEGLRITGGNVLGYGGGVAVMTATATIRNNHIFSNTAEPYGGGVYLWNSSATLTGNSIVSNTATEPSISESRGGGVYLDSSPAILSGNTIANNTSYGYYSRGGGVYLFFSPATLTGNTISGNIVDTTMHDGKGGGVYLDSSNASLIGNTISNNSVAGGYDNNGGGLYLYQSGARLTANTIVSNTTLDAGGGLYLSSSNASLGENVVRHNSASVNGGGMYLYSSSPTLTNTVVADNQASSYGSGIYAYLASFPRLSHATIARNTGGDGSGIHVGVNSGAFLSNLVVVNHRTGITVTTGSTVTLDGVLWFANTANSGGTGAFLPTAEYVGSPAFGPDGYHLTVGSTAVDRGLNVGSTYDIDGEPRPNGLAPDLGADELTLATTCFAQVSSSPGITYTNIQVAVDAAQGGDLVKVAGLCNGASSRAGISQTVYITKPLTLRGGYSTTNWTTSAPITNPTALDAETQGRVIYIAGSISVTVEGLRITGGNGTGLGGGWLGYDAGGGVYAVSATVTLQDNYVLNNSVSDRGGGLYLWQSDATLTGNTILSNNADYGGGGYLEEGFATLTGNSIASNFVRWDGGGLYIAGPATLTGNGIIGNFASYRGGGLSLYSADLVLQGNTISNNSATSHGGGLSLEFGNPVLRENLIISNTGEFGGGLYTYSTAT